MEYLAAVIIGYLLGSIDMAYIVSKIRGVDISSVGSKNPGASNVFLSVGKLCGVIVGAFDIVKAFAAAYIVSLIFPEVPFAGAVAGAAAVIGHIFPVWMRFKGGKGLAPFLGLILFADWREFLAFVVLIAAIMLITDYIVIGTFFTMAAAPVFALVAEQGTILAAMLFMLALLMLWKHRDNIQRLKSGTEIGFRGKNKKT